MHLGKQGEIIPDTPEENDFLARAHVAGLHPQSDYHEMRGGSAVAERLSLVAHLEDGQRTGALAVVRGLARLNMESGPNRARSLHWLTTLAEQAVTDRADH